MTTSQATPVRGTLTIHAVSSVLAPHVGWTVQNVAKTTMPSLSWQPQPAQDAASRTYLEWEGTSGTAIQLASALAAFKKIWFEITVEASPQSDPGRYMYTPALGITYVQTDSEGNFVLTEDRIKTAVERSGTDFWKLLDQLSKDLAEPWDEELEPLREAGVDRSRVIRFKAR